MRPPLPRLLFSITVGVFGLGALIVLTPFDALVRHGLPLLFFILLSFIVKRAGVYAGPDTLHSLVGIVDLAAVFIFGPVIGAWVPSLSSFFYVLLNQIEYGRRSAIGLLESPLFNAGLKVGMSLVSGNLFLALGGALPPNELRLYNVVPAGAAMLAWFALDDLSWAVWEWMRLGLRGFYRLFRQTLVASILVELIPLPFSMVIAVIYTAFGGLTSAIFLLTAAGLIQVGFVIQRYSDSRARLQRRTSDLAALNDFNQAVAEAGFDADRVLQLLLEYSQRVARTDLVRVELLSGDRDRVSLRAEAGSAPEEWDRRDAPLSPALGFMRDHPASLLARDLVTDKLPFEFDPGMNGRRARSAIFVPMLAGEDVSGMLTALNRRARGLGEINQRLLTTLANQAAIAVENARLFTIERRRALQLAIVSEVGRRVAQFLDLDELLKQVVDEIRSRFGYTHVHLLVQNEDGDLLFFASTHPLGAQWRERGERLRHEEGIIGWVAAHAQPLLVPDVTKEPRYAPGPDQALLDTRAELAVPLIVAQRVLGVLDVQSEQPGRFGEEDLFIMRTLAAQLAIAIEDARLYDAQKAEAYYLNVLLNVAENLAETRSLDEALDVVVTLTTLLVGVKRCAVFLYDPASEEFRAARAYGLTPTQQHAFDRLRFPRAAPAPNAFTELWLTEKPVIIEDTEASDLIEPNLAHLFELEAILLVPLVARQQVVGALGVDQGSRSRRFTEHEIEVVKGIANQAAVAIERARLSEQADLKKRLDYELGLARQIQTSFLPLRVPQSDGYELAPAWRSAREVSGDFYDFLEFADGRVGMVIADVSDKGLPASLFMVLTRTVIRTMAFGKPTPHEALARANDLIIADAHSDMFVTAFYGVLDSTTGRLEYSNAGHNPPLWYSHTHGTVTTLKGHGMALGIHPNLDENEDHIELAPGDVVLLYTDGVTDALNADEQEFGMERLADLLAEHQALPAEDLIAEILRAVDEFSAGVPQFDDVTMVAVKRKIQE